MAKKTKPKEQDKPKTSLFGDSGDDDEIDNRTFFIEVTKTLLILLIFGMGTYAVIRAAYSADTNFLPDFLIYFFYPFQYTEVFFTHRISELFGIDVVANYDTFVLRYPALGSGGAFEINPACSAVCEMGLIAAVILSFRGPRWKKRFMWTGIFMVIIYIENIIRLLMNYPLMKQLGEDGWQYYHNIWMAYGQLLVVIVLLGIYVVFIANKEIMAVYKGGGKEADDGGEKDDGGGEGETEKKEEEEEEPRKSRGKKKNRSKKKGAE